MGAPVLLGRGPQRIGERHERDGDAKEAERQGQSLCFMGVSRFQPEGWEFAHDTRAVGR